ncbi:MAG: SLBB domain-containing protein [bacterium]
MLKFFIYTFTVFIVFYQKPLSAQYPPTSGKKESKDTRISTPGAFQTQSSSQQTLTSPGLDMLFDAQSLEAAIDPDTYIVGPGDQFLINIWSTMEAGLHTMVTPEGKLIIPTIGTLNVDGKSLREVQKMVSQAGAKKYVQSTISANLIQVRSFRVHVTGQVRNPGPYSALAVNRVSDIINLAGGFTNWGFERAIEVRHLNGRTDIVDLYQYTKLGNLNTNIYVQGGDVIYVPSIKFTQATVQIEGRVRDPGTYQLVEKETLLDFLLRVNALNRRADLHHAYIERRNADNPDPEIIPLFPFLENQSNGTSNFYLEDGDVILVPQRYEDVFVIGAVRNPGAFPYVPGLAVRDYVGLAGSHELAVDLSKSKIIRRGGTEQLKGANIAVEPGDTVFVPKRNEFGIREITLIVGQATSIIIALKAVGVF